MAGWPIAFWSGRISHLKACRRPQWRPPLFATGMPQPSDRQPRSGARLAAGSDWAVSSANPLRAAHVAVNRTLPGTQAEPLLPGQALTLGQHLGAYTAGSAYVNHLDETGVLEEGMLADLVVLDRDPFDGPADEIAYTGVKATYVGGQRVYAAPPR
jgi:predicted amidohydrolase YtcJ